MDYAKEIEGLFADMQKVIKLFKNHTDRKTDLEKYISSCTAFYAARNILPVTDKSGKSIFLLLSYCLSKMEQKDIMLADWKQLYKFAVSGGIPHKADDAFWNEFVQLATTLDKAHEPPEFHMGVLLLLGIIDDNAK